MQIERHLKGNRLDKGYSFESRSFVVLASSSMIGVLVVLYERGYFYFDLRLACWSLVLGM